MFLGIGGIGPPWNAQFYAELEAKQLALEALYEHKLKLEKLRRKQKQVDEMVARFLLIDKEW